MELGTERVHHKILLQMSHCAAEQVRIVDVHDIVRPSDEDVLSKLTEFDRDGKFQES